jgi:hypothetical protein
MRLTWLTKGQGNEQGRSSNAKWKETKALEDGEAQAPQAEKEDEA